MLTAILSLTDEVGFRNSHFPYIFAPESLDTLFTFNYGGISNLIPSKTS